MTSPSIDTRACVLPDDEGIDKGHRDLGVLGAKHVKVATEAISVCLAFLPQCQSAP